MGNKGVHTDSVVLPRLVVSAPWKSSGKTLVSLGILSYLAENGDDVRSFKKGPDYIDPMWHRLASGRECYNLDTYLMGNWGCLESFIENSMPAKGRLVLIEGNHGLHDGLDLDGSDSCAGLANLLQAPVLLVVDSRKTNRGIAAIVKGMQAMEPRAQIAGVILNRVRNPRQGEKQKSAIERYCGIPVLGMLPHDDELSIPERHLGLTTVEEMAGAANFIKAAARMVACHCDMKRIREIFHKAPPVQARRREKAVVCGDVRAKIGVFRDAAFCFYYPDNLRALTDNGAELVFIDTFHQTGLPEIDGLYIGGGFPESFFGELSGNVGLLRDVRERVETGMPVYAECGGFIYLCRSASWEGRTYQLAGCLPFEIGFQRSPVGHGYVNLISSADSGWFRKGEQVRAHEFHYSRPLSPNVCCSYQFDVVRGSGITGKRDGALYKNLLASFAHLHAAGNPGWAPSFVAMAEAYKKNIRSEFEKSASIY
ncbi:MAG: cobyrinate a,c-diamide synthase [Chlorobiaceae bacterium]|nr:cobyrinate a,c-diamide synthase [Chlorobiaceae bacterium]